MILPIVVYGDPVLRKVGVDIDKDHEGLEQLIADIAINHQTHLLTYYVLELSQLFHRYYSHVRVLDPQDIKKSRARLLMIAIIRSTIGAVLQILGISCPDKM